MRITTKLMTKVLIVLVYTFTVACQPQEKAPLLLDTPENAVRTLSAVCADQDIEGALALYESTARQAIADRIADMRQKAEEVGGVTQKQQNGIALGMLCVPLPDIEVFRLEITGTGSNATVLYISDQDGTDFVDFQIDLVQQEGTWMIVNVELAPNYFSPE